VKAYLINLDRAEDRLSAMSKAFAAAGVEFTRVPAIDGKQLSDEEMSRVVAGEGRWGWLTPTEIGCFLSHRLCWQAIADGADPYGAVFEDDMLFGEQAGEVLSAISWIPDDADIIKLETAGSRIYVDKTNRATVGGRSIQRLRWAHYCAGGYILSRNAARCLLQENISFKESVDDVLFSLETIAAGNSKICQLVPAACIQRSRNKSDPWDALLPSSIEGREQKSMKRLGVAERARLVAFKESQSAINKLLTLLGRRERIVVEFK
jgi:glycosyl transferase family 25